jgi:hypothetical protein
MSTVKPSWIPLRLVGVAARTLPSVRRSRYTQEFTAELYGMPRSRQLRHAAQVLSRVWALRSALDKNTPATIGEEAMNHVRIIPLSCRLNLWHKWRRSTTDDGTRYSQCARCGKEGPDPGAGANTIGA